MKRVKHLDTCWRAALLAVTFLIGATKGHAQSLVLPDLPGADAPVYATTVTGNTLFLGGKFQFVGPPTGAGVAISAAGQVVLVPHIQGTVRAVVPDGSGGWFIGGSFVQVAGVNRINLAHILADGSVAAWNPGANGQVRALVLNGGILYAAGVFTTLGGVSRSHIGAVDADSGTAKAWNPGASGDVYALTSNGVTLFAGGAFTTMAGQTRNRLAAFDLATGNLATWDPNANGDVLTMAMKGTGSVFVGGSFTSVAGSARNRAAEVDASSGGLTSWNPNCSGPINALVTNGTSVFLGGAFQTMGGVPRLHLGSVDATTGAVTNWRPGPNNTIQSLALSGNTLYVGGSFVTIGGADRYRLAALDVTVDTLNATGWVAHADNTVFTLCTNGGTVFAGGNFNIAGGQSRSGVAAIDAMSGSLLSWNPGNLGMWVYSVVTTPFGSTVYVGGQYINGQGLIVALDGTTGATLWSILADTAVQDLVLVGNTLYASGGFTQVDDPPLSGWAARSRLAAFNATTGAVTSWNPSADNYVSAMAVSGSLLYLGGSFTTVGGASRNRLACVDLATGVPTAWNPGADGPVVCLSISGSLIYAGGSFGTIAGQARSNLAAIGADGFLYPWAPSTNSSVLAIQSNGGTVVVGGGFSAVSGQSRNCIARIAWPSGAVSNWNANPADFPTFVRAVAVGSSTLFVGGDFTGIGGATVRPRVAAFTSSEAAVPDAAIAEGNSNLTPVVLNVFLTTPSVDTVTVSWATENVTATAGSDYVAANGTVTFAPGQTSQSIVVNVVGDTQAEPDETFNIRLTGATFTSIGDAVGVITILDDESMSVVCKDFYATDGIVHAMTESNGVLYLGGEFTVVGPPTGGGAPLDPATGLAIDIPRVTGTVRAVASDGAGGWYLGGEFTKVGGIGRLNLAHVRADHSVSEWSPNANGRVEAILVIGSTIYVGGDFTVVGGQPRSRIAALDAATGLATSWNPGADGSVLDLAVDGGTLYVAGGFSTIGGVTRHFIAAFSTATGLATSWNPDADNVVRSLVPSGGTIYVGGSFTQIGGQARNRLAALDPATGVAGAWNPNANGTVFAMAISGSKLIAGGSFGTVGGQVRNAAAAIDLATGAVANWLANPNNTVYAVAAQGPTVYLGGAFDLVAGQPRKCIAAVDANGSGVPASWNPSATGGASPAVYALAVDASAVYAGGSFLLAGAQPRSNLAAIQLGTGVVSEWNPSASGAVRALAVRGGTVYVGGDFTFMGTIGVDARPRLAAVSVSTGLASAWTPNPNSSVKSLAVTPTGTLVVGGTFTTIAGQTRNRIASFNGADNLTSWNPNANFEVSTIVPNGALIYVGGNFGIIGGQSRGHIAALDSTTGLATTWNPGASGSSVVAIRVASGLAYVAGNFTSIGGLSRGGLAAVSTSTGQATNWNPSPSGSVLAMWLDGTTLYVGGIFSTIGGQSRSSVAALDTGTGLANTWNPGATGMVETLLSAGARTYFGGNITQVAGLPAGGLACTVPLSSVDAPPAGPVTALAFAALRPNPTRGETWFEFALPEAGHVRIDVYDLQGRVRARPMDGPSPAGRHVIAWDTRTDGLPPGMYFVRLSVGSRRITRTLVLVH